MFVRDDGSSDNTKQILREYEKKDSRIVFLEEMSQFNLGVKKSFFSLLEYVDKKYYFFCDQDDVWLSNKVEDTLKILKKKENADIPMCVHTDLKIVDKDLVVINPSMIKSQSLYKEDSLNNLLVQNSVTGCTMAINNSLKLLFTNDIKIDNIIMHDWWLALIAASFGSVELLDEPTILYRQHGNNEVGAQSILQKISSGYGLNKLLDSVAKSLVQARELKANFGDKLPKQKLYVIDLYLSVMYSKGHSIKWFGEYKKNGFLRNFVFRLLFFMKKKEIKKLYMDRS